MSLDEVLEIIDTFMLNGHDAGALYDILTALRGPDTNDSRFSDLKVPITTVIRYAVCKKSRLQFRGLIENDSVPKAEARVAVYNELRRDLRYAHFLSHAYMAFTSLGLVWDRANDINPGRKGYVLQERAN